MYIELFAELDGRRASRLYEMPADGIDPNDLELPIEAVAETETIPEKSSGVVTVESQIDETENSAVLDLCVVEIVESFGRTALNVEPYYDDVTFEDLLAAGFIELPAEKAVDEVVAETTEKTSETADESQAMTETVTEPESTAETVDEKCSSLNISA